MMTDVSDDTESDADWLPAWPVVCRLGEYQFHRQAKLAIQVGHPVIFISPETRSVDFERYDSGEGCCCGLCPWSKKAKHSSSC